MRSVVLVERQRGMTAVELMVTIMIMAIVTTLAVPSFRESTRQSRLRGQTNEFIAALRITQSEAIKRGKAVVLCKSSDPETATTPACSTDTAVNWENGWVIFVDEDANGAISTSETVLRRAAPLTAGSTLRGSTGVGSAVAYQATGETTGPGTFVLCENNDITRSRAVFLGTNGRIRLADRASSGAPTNDTGTALSSSACLSP